MTKNETDCSTSGKGFARTEKNNIAPENCGCFSGAGKGFAKSDFVKKQGKQ